jgi:hypothetical protein
MEKQMIITESHSSWSVSSMAQDAIYYTTQRLWLEVKGKALPVTGREGP